MSILSSFVFQSFYSERFGNENVVIIKDSNVVETAKLDSSKAYLQITYVEPYFEIHELRHRVTVFEKNCGLSKQQYLFLLYLIIINIFYILIYEIVTLYLFRYNRFL